MPGMNTTPAVTVASPSAEPDETWEGWSVVLEVIYFIIALLGILGNGIIVFALVKVKYLKSFTNVLVTNQSAIDLVSSIMFFALYVLPRPTLPTGSNAFDLFLCKFWLSEYPLWAFSVSSTVNLVCLTFDRYFAVIHPVIYRNKFTIGKGKVLCILPWIIGILHEVPWMYVHKVTPDSSSCEPMWPHGGAQKIFGVIVFINHYLIPLVIMVYVYTRIILRLKRELRPPSTPTSPATQPAEKPKKRHFATVASRSVLKTMIIVSMSYLICWGPNEIIYLYFNCGNDVDFTSFIVTVTVICVLCNMWLNPIIYALNYKELRRGIIDSFSFITYRIPALRKLGSADRKSSALNKGDTLRDTISGNGSIRGGSDEANKV